MLRIAIIGCGKVADQHVQAMRRIENCSIVSLCDRELLMARQLGERIGVDNCYGSVEDLLTATRPDVVHITTPPQSHFALAEQCLRHGTHVYLEKPFTIDATEAERLIQLAETARLKITAGHNYQFTPEMLRARAAIQRGFLGGTPVHLESYWPYSLDDQAYVGAVLSNRDHWVRKLPGQLFHNIISHGIAKLAEHLDDNIVELVAKAHQSEQLRGMGESDICDELRVLLRDGRGTTAFFSFSTSIKPSVNLLRLYGRNGTLVADYMSGTLLAHRNRSYKSYLTYFVPPLISARQHFRGAVGNMSAFIRRRLYQDFGMKELFEQFYNCIRRDGPPPIPYREIILTARIMDTIFAQIRPTI